VKQGDTVVIHDDEKLSRLLRQAGPDSIPKLEADPHLPVRIRASAQSTRKRSPFEARPRRWFSVSMVTAALTAAMVVGAYLGHSAGTSSAAVGDAETTPSDAMQEIASFYNALSQTGFAEDLVGAESDDAREDG